MAKPRSSSRNSRSQVARPTYSGARPSPATSANWSGFASPPSSLNITWAPPRRPRYVQTPAKVPPRPVKDVFGTWSYSPTTSSLKSPCEARAQRREVLFSTRRTGAGSRSTNRRYTNRSCK